MVGRGQRPCIPGVVTVLHFPRKITSRSTEEYDKEDAKLELALFLLPCSVLVLLFYDEQAKVVDFINAFHTPTARTHVHTAHSPYPQSSTTSIRDRRSFWNLIFSFCEATHTTQYNILKHDDHGAVEEVLVFRRWGGGGFSCCFHRARLLGLLPTGTRTSTDFDTEYSTAAAVGVLNQDLLH